MKSLASILASPALCLALLAGVVVENRTHARPEDAAPYHRQAKAAIQAWPKSIGDEWTSRELELPKEAVQLLRPNVELCRRYVSSRSERSADLLIVQCREPNDMSGHYPPNCYPANGEAMVRQEARTWQVGDVAVRGMEYHFEAGIPGQLQRHCVYNFFVLPGRGIVPDMRDVRDASGDYQRRHFGAAQFQLVFEGEMPQESRDEMFVAIIGAQPGVFVTLNPAGI